MGMETGRMTQGRRGRRGLRVAAVVAVVSMGMGAASADDSATRTRLLSRATDGTAADRASGSYSGATPSEVRISMTPQGRNVVFSSLAGNLVPPGDPNVMDNNGQPDIYLRDRDTDADGALDTPGKVTTERVSRSWTPNPPDYWGRQSWDPDGASVWPAVSSDARNVSFTSWATNLVEGDTNGVPDVFVRDRATGQTVRVSVSAAGDQAPAFGSSFAASMTPSGRFVGFTSWASNLDAADTNRCGPASHPEACADVFVRDRDSDGNGVFDESGGVATELASKTDGGGAGNDNSGADWNGNLVPTFAGWAPAISDDGRFVAFVSWASNLVARDTNLVSDVFVRDRQSGSTTRVSVTSSGAQVDGSSSEPIISGNGRFVVFRSNAPNLDPADTNKDPDLFVRDMSAGTTNMVCPSVSAKSHATFISSDGRFIGIQADNGNVYVCDRDTDTDGIFDEAGAVSAISAGGSSAFGAAVSSDGRWVSFYGGSGNSADTTCGCTSAYATDMTYVAPPPPSSGTKVKDNPSGSTTVYSDSDGDGTADPGETQGTVPSAQRGQLVEVVQVDAHQGAPTASATELAAGGRYLFEASGIYRYQNPASTFAFPPVADPECSSKNGSTWVADDYKQYASNDLLDLHVDGTAIVWWPLGASTSAGCSASHTYEYVYTGQGAPVSFWVNDDAGHGDNLGSLVVEIYALS